MLASIFAIVAVIGLFPVRSSNAALDPKLNVRQLSFPGLAASAPLVAQTEFRASPQPLTVTAPEVSEGTVLGADDVTEGELAARALAAENSSVDVGDTDSVQSRRIAMYLTYVVQEGDTVTSIASDYGLERNYILWNNVDLDNVDLLSVGQPIRVPYQPGIVHAVEFEQTLTDIARLYGATTEDILNFEANSLSDPNLLVVNEFIFVPGGRILPPVAVSIRPGADLVPTKTGEWLWPTGITGTLTSFFGPGHWLGIDIALPEQNVVRASRDGVVTFAAGDPWVSYGWYIKIDHGDGWETTYAHLLGIPDDMYLGKVVAEGDFLAYSGNSGHSTGPHLHFETRFYGEHQNPLDYIQ